MLRRHSRAPSPVCACASGVARIASAAVGLLGVLKPPRTRVCVCGAWVAESRVCVGRWNCARARVGEEVREERASACSSTWRRRGF